MTKQERDELCIALSATQECAIIQLMLEICLPTNKEVGFNWNVVGGYLIYAIGIVFLLSLSHHLDLSLLP